MILSNGQMEKMFNRSWELSFVKKKYLFFAPFLLLCGLLAVICRAMAANAGEWIQINLAFLPFFLCGGGICIGGIVLCRIYYHEVRKENFTYRNLLKQTAPLFTHAAYLTAPLLMSYLVFWAILGLFYLLRAIPIAGPYMGAVFSFAPFLLLLASLILGGINVGALFYLTAPFAFRKEELLDLFQEGWMYCKQSPFFSIKMLLIGFLPTLIVGTVLSFVAFLTHKMYLDTGGTALILLKWLFMMIPFVALLTPALIFFFNFSVEIYMLFRKEREKAEKPESSDLCKLQL